ncbi:MAG TPA: HYR domain-containing protein [Planctomycetota bacterium]
MEGRTMLDSALRSIFFVGVLALGSAARAQAAATPGPEQLDRFEEVTSPVVFEGFVFAPDGSPAEGAVVVTSAGGKAVVDARGHYRLEARVPREAERVQVTAVGSSGRNLVASASVGVSASASSVGVDPLSLSQGSTCSPSWLPTFGGAPGTNTFGVVNALAEHDDGGGSALYVGGEFTSAGGVEASHIARWDGASWSPLGGGMNGQGVHALAVYDDGVGPALYAGGWFTTAGGTDASRIARWDGSSWSALGSGMRGSGVVEFAAVDALTVYDDGRGPALYAGGVFTTAGGVAAKNIARWDGSSWNALGSGMNDWVFALAVHDDGAGSALYAGGSFTTAGGVSASRIARWDGSSWSVLGSGMNEQVSALAVHDDGGGPALYAGGWFTTAGGVAASRIARWDGSRWSPLGSGMNRYVSSLAVYDGGGGPALYAGGDFTTAGGGATRRIARWDGSSWSALGSGMGGSGSPIPVNALAVHDTGSGPALYGAGLFATAGGVAASNIARWDGSRWSALGSGLNNEVDALAVSDPGGGHALYAGGGFLTAGGVAASRIARWDGSTWSALGGGITDSGVSALAVYDERLRGGPALHVGGGFTAAGGVAASRVARWDGSSWRALGSGMNLNVDALAAYDDGGGPALYAGGVFTTAGGVAAGRIARWNGSSWSALGSGMNRAVSALAAYDDGNGPALYAGGGFTTAGGMAANYIARWDGSRWSALGSGIDESERNEVVSALAVYDDGSGPALYVGGGFTGAGGAPASNIARWDGSSWSALGSGMNWFVRALAVYDDGSGPALYAGGDFTTAGGVAARHIARWDGSSWSALGSGMNGAVEALAVYDDGGGAALYAGGTFTSAADSGDSYLAKWGCLDKIPPVLDCPSSISVVDSAANGAGEVVTFKVTATDDRDPAPSVVCAPPSGSYFPRGTTVVTCTATDASGNEATCQFKVTVQAKASAR